MQTDFERKEWYVYIIETESGNVIDEMGPMYEREAEQVRRGISINLNYDEYHIDVDEGRRERTYL